MCWWGLVGCWGLRVGGSVVRGRFFGGVWFGCTMECSLVVRPSRLLAGVLYGVVWVCGGGARVGDGGDCGVG